MKKLSITLGAATAIAAAMSFIPNSASGEGRLTIEEMVPALASKKTENDEFPGQIGKTILTDIDEESIRAVAQDERANYWIAKSGTTNICLIAHIPGGYEVAASTCAPATTVFNQGMGLLVSEAGADERTVEAYLLPQDVDAESIAAANPGTRILANDDAKIVTRFPDEAEGIQVTTAARSSGGDFILTPLRREG